jgi:B12-binding domain/radical SAM domain protein
MVSADACIVLWKTPETKYSINALVAALDLRIRADIIVTETYDATVNALRLLCGKCRLLIVGVSLLTYMLADDKYLSSILELTRIAGRLGATSIAGGPHATGDPLGTVLSLGFNYAVIGEGEETLPELIRSLMDKGDPLSVKGIFTIQDGEPAFTGRRRPIILDDYPPFPYWRLTFNPVEITRGCPYACKYCQVSYMHGRTMRHRSIDTVREYASIMVKYGLRHLRFISPDSLAYGLKGAFREPRLDAVEELLSTIYERVARPAGARIYYGSFPSEVRPEHLTREAARILRKYVSNREIILGAQTGSDRLLKAIGRGHSIEDVYEAVENALAYRFTPDVDFIIGLPGETRSDLEESLRAMEKLASMGARIHLHVFLPLPGTPYAYMEPGRVPEWAKSRLARIIGAGRAYGQWMHQERLAWKIKELRDKGIILPRAKHIRVK